MATPSLALSGSGCNNMGIPCKNTKMPTSCPFVGPMVGLELAIASSRTKPKKMNKTERRNQNPGFDVLCNGGTLSAEECGRSCSFEF